MEGNAISMLEAFVYKHLPHRQRSSPLAKTHLITKVSLFPPAFSPFMHPSAKASPIKTYFPASGLSTKGVSTPTIRTIISPYLVCLGTSPVFPTRALELFSIRTDNPSYLLNPSRSLLPRRFVVLGNLVRGAYLDFDRFFMGLVITPVV